MAESNSKVRPQRDNLNFMNGQPQPGGGVNLDDQFQDAAGNGDKDEEYWSCEPSTRNPQLCPICKAAENNQVGNNEWSQVKQLSSNQPVLISLYFPFLSLRNEAKLRHQVFQALVCPFGGPGHLMALAESSSSEAGASRAILEKLFFISQAIISPHFFW